MFQDKQILYEYVICICLGAGCGFVILNENYMAGACGQCNMCSDWISVGELFSLNAHWLIMNYARRKQNNLLVAVF